MKIPMHIAIIPDGNRRWASKRHLPAAEGHRSAAEKTLPKLIEKAANLNIKYFTFWALSTENLVGRTKVEVDNLLNLMRFFFDKRFNEFMKKDVKLVVIGDLARLPNDLQEKISRAVDASKNNQKITVILGINYGGRDEIVRAIRRIFNSPFVFARGGQFSISNLNQEMFKDFLDTRNIPDPDLIIRTGGEKRLSGFFLWQSEYSELYFSDVFFPDFTEEDLEKAIIDYDQRQRRYGK